MNPVSQPPLPPRKAGTRGNGRSAPRTYLVRELLETREAQGQHGAGPSRAAHGFVPLLDAPARRDNAADGPCPGTPGELHPQGQGNRGTGPGGTRRSR